MNSPTIELSMQLIRQIQLEQDVGANSSGFLPLIKNNDNSSSQHRHRGWNPMCTTLLKSPTIQKPETRECYLKARGNKGFGNLESRENNELGESHRLNYSLKEKQGSTTGKWTWLDELYFECTLLFHLISNLPSGQKLKVLCSLKNRSSLLIARLLLLVVPVVLAGALFLLFSTTVVGNYREPLENKPQQEDIKTKPGNVVGFVISMCLHLLFAVKIFIATHFCI